jgi:hypothetical protein
VTGIDGEAFHTFDGKFVDEVHPDWGEHGMVGKPGNLKVICHPFHFC